MVYAFLYTDPETDLTFEYDPDAGVVYVTARGETWRQSDRLRVGYNRRFLQSNILRLVRQYKDAGGKKYAAWQESGEYVQLAL